MYAVLERDAIRFAPAADSIASQEALCSSSPYLQGFRFPEEHEGECAIAVTHTDAIALINLATGYQVRQRLREQALNRSLQMPCAIPPIGPPSAKTPWRYW